MRDKAYIKIRPALMRLANSVMNEKSLISGVRALLPKWTGGALVVAVVLSVVGVIFARLTASRVPDPSTGQIYQIYFGKSQSYWYLNFWQWVVYRVLTVPGICLMLVVLVAALFAVGRDYWHRYHK
jgi:hypothetical protein